MAHQVAAYFLFDHATSSISGSPWIQWIRASPLQGDPQHYARIHSFTGWRERHCESENVFGQELNTMSPAMARTQTSRTRVQLAL